MSNLPTVNVACERGGFSVTASVQLPDCSVDTAFRALSDFSNYTSWNPTLKQFVPVRAAGKKPTHTGGPSTIRVVQNVGVLSFSKTFTTYLEAEPQPAQRAVSFGLVSSDLYHRYQSNFSVHDAPEGARGALVKYEGHVKLKFGPPPPLGRVLIPRSLRAAITEMLDQLQQQTSKGKAGHSKAPQGLFGAAVVA